MGVLRIVLALAGCLVLGFALSCGGGTKAGGPAVPTPADVSLDQLQELLNSELASRGIDPGKTAAVAPSGADSAVYDLEATVTLGNGQEIPDVAELTWTGQLPGDYDQNGEVNSADLAPLAQNYGAKVQYLTDPPDPDVTWWPAGDVTDTGGAEPGDPPATDSGARNWRLARIDGDHNGEINSGDVAVIAQHWMERASGYRVYRRGINETEFALLPNPLDADSALTISRPELSPGMPERYSFADVLPGSDYYTYYVAACEENGESEGPPSKRASLLSPYAPTVTLMADPTEGFAPLTVHFSADANEKFDDALTYDWDFDGDGVFDIQLNSNATDHTYTEIGNFDAHVQAQDPNGKIATAEVKIRVGFPPLASFTVTPDSGVPPLEVTLDASASTDPGGEIVHYEWDLDGDGEFETDGGDAPVLVHLFESQTLSVGLQVTDNDGYQDQTSVPILINTPPVAAFTLPDGEFSDLSVQFDASGSYDPDGDQILYDWDFEGDGTVDFSTWTQTNFTHTYWGYGDFHPSLQVRDSYGWGSTTSGHVICNGPPNAAISTDIRFGVAPLTVTLSAEDSYDEPGGWIVGYEFDFDGDLVFDTPVLSDPVIQHTYDEINSYTAYVRVTDNLGLQDVAGVNVNTSRWNIAHDFEALSNPITGIDYDIAQVGSRLAMVYCPHSTSNSLWIQFSDEGSYHDWSTPPLLLDSRGGSNLPRIVLIEGAPCVTYRNGRYLYLTRSLDLAADQWSNPIWLADFQSYDYLDGTTYDIQQVGGKACIAYASSGQIGYLRSLNAEGTEWSSATSIWSYYLFNSRQKILLSSFSDTPGIWYDPGSGECYFLLADDASQTTWSHYRLVESPDYGSLPEHQPSSVFEGLPFSGLVLNGQFALITVDPEMPAEYTSYFLPVDYDNVQDTNLLSVILADGLPQLACGIQRHPADDKYLDTVSLYSARDSTLANWDSEVICGEKIAPYTNRHVRLCRFNGVTLACCTGWDNLMLLEPPE